MSANFANLTPFAAHHVVNIRLRAAGIEDVQVRPQMMYTYAKKGIIASNYDTRAEGEKVYFDGDEFKAWLDRYVQKVKSGSSGARVDYDKLAEQYM
jgi:hypothetical protein